MNTKNASPRRTHCAGIVAAADAYMLPVLAVFVLLLVAAALACESKAA